MTSRKTKIVARSERQLRRLLAGQGFAPSEVALTSAEGQRGGKYIVELLQRVPKKSLGRLPGWYSGAELLVLSQSTGIEVVGDACSDMTLARLDCRDTVVEPRPWRPPV
jgi:hypothetical protein